MWCLAIFAQADAVATGTADWGLGIGPVCLAAQPTRILPYPAQIRNIIKHAPPPDFWTLCRSHPNGPGRYLSAVFVHLGRIPGGVGLLAYRREHARRGDGVAYMSYSTNEKIAVFFGPLGGMVLQPGKRPRSVRSADIGPAPCAWWIALTTK